MLIYLFVNSVKQNFHWASLWIYFTCCPIASSTSVTLALHFAHFWHWRTSSEDPAGLHLPVAGSNTGSALVSCLGFIRFPPQKFRWSVTTTDPVEAPGMLSRMDEAILEGAAL